MTKKSIWQVIDDLTKDMIPTVRNAFSASISDVTNKVILQDLVTSIRLGDVLGAFRVLGFTEAAMRPLTAAVELALERGGIAVGGTFPSILNTPTGRAVFRFDVRNSRAEAWLRDRSSSLVTRLQGEARVNLQNTMFEGLRAGDNPRTTALNVVGRINPQSGLREGGVIGLAQNQERWTARAKQQLENLDAAYFQREMRDKRFDRTVEKAIREGKPLSKEVITKLTDRYKDNLLKLRGDTIARTETIQSLNRAEWEALKQAADMGAINEQSTKREWDDVGDSRTRRSHRRMNKQQVGLDEPFKTPGGELLMHPGDTTLGASADETIACRCRVKTVIDWFEDVD